MKIIQLKCPKCGAPLEAEDDLEIFFCKYCGQKIILAEQSNAQIGAKMFGKFLNHREKMHQMKVEEQKRNDRMAWLGILCIAIIGLIFSLAAFLLR